MVIAGGNCGARRTVAREWLNTTAKRVARVVKSEEMSPATSFGRAIWCVNGGGRRGGAGAKRQDGMVWAEGGEVCNTGGRWRWGA